MHNTLNVIVVKNNYVESISAFESNEIEQAEEAFAKACNAYNEKKWQDADDEEKQGIIEDGIFTIDNGSVCLA